ncbi:ATP-binding protein [Pseudogracilibacillus auburnensis]|uniref:ATP-binding protein n=1 Tax=Pseudogracilibacillus auburnensis TaxID=1494959 RepID=UPI001A95820B|nr:ATP-binding protein [Pseudogracilibacillus auburnensis]MBO1005293.1 response regulator [Pseudogracilibacillus auburnensis]
MKRGIVALFILLLFQLMVPMNIFATDTDTETIYLLPDMNRTPIKEHLYILEDKEKKWKIDDVLSEPRASQFQKNRGGIPNFGYNSSAYWVYFIVNNQTEAEKFLFEIGYPSLNDIELYIYDDTGLSEKILMGSKYPFNERKLFHPNFLRIFELEQNETITFYIRFESRTSLQMPLYIYEQSGFIQTRQFDILILGITYGILGVMALYNLFIFFILRHMSYLYYVLVILATFFSNLSFTGVAYQYLWPNSPKWNELSVVFFLVLGMVFAVLFAYTFLEIKKHLPRFKVLFQTAFVLNVLLLFFVLYAVDIALRLLSVIITAMFVLILLSALLSWKRGLRQARFFILAWAIFLCGVFLTVLSDGAFIPLNTFTKYSGQVAAMIEVVLLSFALADRINILQREKNEAVQQLYRSQKLANESLRRADTLKDEFLATTSHELRTPLNGIVGIAETLQEGAVGKLSKDVQAQLSLIVLSGKRLFNLINDILDFSKLKNKELPLALAPVNMKEIADVVIMMCTPLMNGKKIKIHNRIEASTALVHADENRVQQILFNIIGNAIKFTDEGNINISAKEENHQVKISISDTGRGISPAEVPYIFDQFQQAQFNDGQAVGGTGIGLSITKQLVELHGGEITVKSKVKQGTTFYFTLLKSEEEITSKKEVTSSIAPVVPSEELSLIPTVNKTISEERTSTILIADDEIVNLQVLVHQLTLDGYSVIYAQNGEEVLQKVQEEEVDLVILDIMMPKMSGYDVCKHLREKYSLMELPILMLTAKNQLQDKLTSFEVGANDYLTKPCERKELLSRVKTLLQLHHLNKQLIQFNRILEEKVRERTNKLELSNRTLTDVLQSRQQLLANISHELGTPVTVIHGYVQAVREGLIPVNDENYLRLVFDKVTILNRLIDDLADLSKLEAGQLRFNKQIVELREWISDMNKTYELEVTNADRMYHMKSDSLELFSDYVCEIDIERMGQVFSNILWNAINHTEVQIGKISIDVHIISSKHEVLFAIEDNGHGIAQENLPYIFERFYKGTEETNKRFGDSTGLGLAISKEIVEAHEGRIWVESEIDKGTIFYLVLPFIYLKEMDSKEILYEFSKK